MKIKLDNRKYKKLIRPLSFVIVTFSCIIAMIFVMNAIQSKGLDSEKVLAIFLGSTLLLFPLLLARFYYRLKKRHEYVMVFENGIFIDYSKPFVKPVPVRIEEIKSITHWRGNEKGNQYKIITIKDEANRSEFINQLKGNHRYITDFMVDSEELHKLFRQIHDALD
jgi:hypothetical protein